MTLVELLGSRTVILIESEGREIRVVIQGESAVKEGEAVKLTLDLERAFYFDSNGESISATDEHG